MALHAGAKVVEHSNGEGQQGARMKSPFSREVTIILVACFLIASRAAHSILCQPFKAANAKMPVLIVMVEAFSFPVSMLIWIAMSLSSQGRVFVPNCSYRLSMYALMGFLDAINSYMSAVSALKLNIAVYTVLKASSIVFSVVFAKMFTKKQFTLWHYLAVTIMFGASFLSCFDEKNQKRSEAKDSSLELILGALAALLSAASLGLLGVTTYKFVRHEKQKSEMLCIAENNAFQALFMFIFVLPMFAMPEIQKWPVVTVRFADYYSWSALIWICVGFFISRPIMLFSSIAATSFASAAMTRALGAPRRLVVVTVVYFVFNDPLNWVKGSSIALMCISLVIYAYGGFVLQQMKKRISKAMTIKDVEKGDSCSVRK